MFIFSYIENVIDFVANLNIETWVQVVNILASCAIIFAVRTYYYNKNRDGILFMVDQISFFREKILPEENVFIQFIREKDPNYIFNRVKLDVPTTKEINEKYPNEAKGQIELIKKYNSTPLEINILNLLEDFSLRIIYSKMFKHKAFASVKHIFIQSVEMHTITLMTQREVISGNYAYSSTLKLYKKWKDEVDRSSPDDRLKRIVELNSSKGV